MGKMKEIDIMLHNQIKPIHDRLLQAQKDIKNLKNTAYAEHRLVAKMHDQMNAQQKAMDAIKEMFDAIIEAMEKTQDDGK